MVVRTTVKDVEVKREGTQIVLPPKMSWDEAIEWMRRKKDEDERNVGIHHELHYSPLDGAVAFQRALAHKYGWAELIPTPGFWGDSPPTMIGVPVSVSDKIQVPWGRVAIPGIAGFLQTGIAAEPTPRFVINGQVKQKHAAEIKELVDLTEHFLKTESIYKSKAIKVSFEWQREGCSFDPNEHCPKFMRLDGVNEEDLIFGDDVQNALDIGLFIPIEHAKACREFHVPLKRGVLLYGPYGVGKCLGKDTPILMHNGEIKKVQDVQAGDLLMGVDSKPRTVQSICKGRDKMYKVTPKKGDPYIVNSAHILSLKVTSEWCAGRYGKHGDVVNMNVQEYASLPKFVRQGLAGWRTHVDFPYQEVALDPYFVGLWLGDGDSRNPAITTADFEIEQYIGEIAAMYNLLVRDEQPSGDENKSLTYHITAGNHGPRNIDDESQAHGSRGRNPVRSLLQQYGLLRADKVVVPKFIPSQYKCNNREIRLRLLAGLVDTDGSKSNNCLDICTKFDQLADDILYLCRSLGYAAYKKRKFVKVAGEEKSYWRITVSGDLSEIPTRLAHKRFKKRKQKKSVSVTALHVEEMTENDYYGFVLDGDHLFMLGDFTVTHNTLTANVTAIKATRSGFTFVYLDNVSDLKKGCQFAAQYAPSVLFAEDVDRATDGERNLSMDELLNTLDGVDTKGGEVITVFTTNHVENINPALLRMGRLDTLVEVKEPDAKAAERLVKLYGRGLLAPDMDLRKVGKALQGNIPAFIRETVERAKLAAIARLNGGDIKGEVRESDLLTAAKAMEAHAAMLKVRPGERKGFPELLVRIPKNHSTAAKRVLESLGATNDGEE